MHSADAGYVQFHYAPYRSVSNILLIGIILVYVFCVHSTDVLQGEATPKT